MKQPAKSDSELIKKYGDKSTRETKEAIKKSVTEPRKEDRKNSLGKK